MTARFSLPEVGPDKRGKPYPIIHHDLCAGCQTPPSRKE